MMTMCAGQKLSAWYKAVVPPPKHWTEDKEYGNAHFVTAYFPDKPSLEALIYVQVSLHRNNQTLEQNIQQNQGIWRKSEPRVKITPLAPVSRGGKRAPFMVFLYENPTRPKQAFEMVAFTLEKRPDGSHFIVTVVEAASSRKAIDDSRDAYMTLLREL